MADNITIRMTRGILKDIIAESVEKAILRESNRRGAGRRLNEMNTLTNYVEPLYDDDEEWERTVNVTAYYRNEDGDEIIREFKDVPVVVYGRRSDDFYPDWSLTDLYGQIKWQLPQEIDDYTLWDWDYDTEDWM